jgi:hypothetical protein
LAAALFLVQSRDTGKIAAGAECSNDATFTTGFDNIQ